MIYRCILPDWASKENPSARRVIEGELSEDQIQSYNKQGYNIYYLPNQPSVYDPSHAVDGRDIDEFNYIFVDFDLKTDTTYGDKKTFIDTILSYKLPPTAIIDSGNGIHAYWPVSNLNAMDYLRFQKRLIRQFKTDEAIAKIYQLLRVPGTYNTKVEGQFKLCQAIDPDERFGLGVYTAEEVDKALPPITPEDEAYCQQHYERTYNLSNNAYNIKDEIPLKFANLLKNNSEVSSIWAGGVDDRSKSDWRLAHIMLASSFSKEDALSVLVNAPKALSRSPQHRISYATNIIDKIWTHETTKNKQLLLSSSASDILNRPVSSAKGTRLQCYRWIDDTAYGFRLGHVMGLVAGSGVGKTVIALNLFLGFVESNPDYDHFFVTLEQTDDEIAERWKALCGEDKALHDRVHILSNYNEDGSFRHLALDQIKDYLVQFQKESGRKVGCCVIDHIGILKKQTKDGENQGLIDLCHQMKSFAIETGTFLIMQSQSSREKAGIGDLEIGKDAAFGTVFFESYTDFLVTLWQPLKRCYTESGCPTVTAFKFGKIRHKNQKLDTIKEDICYRMFFDPDSGRLRPMTQDEEKSFEFFLNRATNKRKQDRKTDLVAYTSVREDINGAAKNNQDLVRTTRPNSILTG